MAKHPGQRRLTQNQTDSEDDVFIAKVLEVGTWAKSNQQLLTIAVVLVAVGVASLLYYRNYRAGLIARAGNQLEQIQSSVSLNE